MAKKQLKRFARAKRRWDLAYRLEHRKTSGKNRKRPGNEE